ncbi:MAG: CocE/NonD family hydrolase [Steroidobacteraceae bacterium]
MSRPTLRPWPMLLALLLALPALQAMAQTLEFQPPATPLDAAAAATMRDLAVRVLPVYEEKNQDRFLNNLSGIQVVAGAYAPANASRQSLRERRRENDEESGRERLLDIYVRALALQRERSLPFAQAFAQVFRDTVTPLTDLEAFAVTGWRLPPLADQQLLLQRALDLHRSRRAIALPEAVELLWRYFVFDAYRRIAEPLEELRQEDDRRRYVFEDVRIAGAGGARIAATIVRPKVVRALPTLLEFTALRDPREPLTGPAAHGYAGIIAWARGSRDGGQVVPFLFDGEDARSVIQWVERQPWNDGRVGMQGEGYAGFVAWAAAGRAPPALKAIATADPLAPGIDMPMSGGIFHNSAYRWLQRLNPGRDAGTGADVDDDAAWQGLDEKWYASGRRYRDLDRLNGKPDPVFQRWLSHPSYDRYWQKMIPFAQQFAQVKIPVLTITGYYAANQAAALYYFDQHLRHLPKADHRLLLGPYAAGSGPRPGALLRRLPVEASARVDLTELRYQWFDHVLKNAARPAPLQDRVNFVTGGVDEWRHAASLDAMGNATLRLYLDSREVPGGYLLAQQEAKPATFLRTEVALRERDDAGFTIRPDYVTRAPQTRHALTWISAPLPAAVDIAGSPGGRLDLMTNKLDVDLTLSLYELQANGDYVKLFDPAVTFRASYAGDRTQRRLLKAGRVQQIPLHSERVMSRRIAAGSRLVLVLGVNKRPDQQINYGAGGDVSEESIADARYPVRLRWYSSSHLELPIRKP